MRGVKNNNTDLLFHSLVDFFLYVPWPGSSLQPPTTLAYQEVTLSTELSSQDFLLFFLLNPLFDSQGSLTCCYTQQFWFLNIVSLDFLILVYPTLRFFVRVQPSRILTQNRVVVHQGSHLWGHLDSNFVSLAHTASFLPPVPGQQMTLRQKQYHRWSQRCFPAPSWSNTNNSSPLY